MTEVHIKHAMGMSKALRIARSLCHRVEPVRRTGEVKVQPTPDSGWIRLSARRKEAPRALTVALRQLVRGRR